MTLRKGFPVASSMDLPMIIATKQIGMWERTAI